MKKASEKSILSNPGSGFEDYINDALGELFESMRELREEYNRVMNINSVLIHTNKTLKKIMIDKGVFNEKEFIRIYEKELKDTESQFKKHMKQQENLYMEYLINNVPPANS